MTNEENQKQNEEQPEDFGPEPQIEDAVQEGAPGTTKEEPDKPRDYCFDSSDYSDEGNIRR